MTKKSTALKDYTLWSKHVVEGDEEKTGVKYIMRQRTI